MQRLQILDGMVSINWGAGGGRKEVCSCKTQALVGSSFDSEVLAFVHPELHPCL